MPGRIKPWIKYNNSLKLEINYIFFFNFAHDSLEPSAEVFNTSYKSHTQDYSYKAPYI